MNCPSSHRSDCLLVLYYNIHTILIYTCVDVIVTRNVIKGTAMSISHRLLEFLIKYTKQIICLCFCVCQITCTVLCFSDEQNEELTSNKDMDVNNCFCCIIGNKNNIPLPNTCSKLIKKTNRNNCEITDKTTNKTKSDLRYNFSQRKTKHRHTIGNLEIMAW